jgi:dGTPase
MIRRRHDFERTEREALAPYATTSENAGPREHEEPEDPFRGALQRDRDRVVHCTAFRSLQHKTQVFVVHEGDLIRTRLTHTIEVAQIARSLSSYLAANADLAEAISLAHDLGHAPFGHAGEEELSDALVALGAPAFDHNLQSLRIVSELERHDPAFPGLNLSYATREGIARHETAYDRPPVVKRYYVTAQPAIEAQVANIADPLAYTTHDLEDALKLGFFDEDDLCDLGLPLVTEAVRGARLAAPGKERDRAFARFHLIHRKLIGRLAQDVLEETERRLAALPGAGARGPDREAVRAADRPVVDFGPAVKEDVDRLRRFLHRRVYKSPVVLNMCTKGRRILRALFDHFVAHPDHLPRSVQARFPEGRAPAAPAARTGVVVDFVAGLTDRGAMDWYQALFEPYERTLPSLL